MEAYSSWVIRVYAIFFVVNFAKKNFLLQLKACIELLIYNELLITNVNS